MIRTAELYAQPILGIQETDVVFSAAKLFFAYGLGNALSFPLSVGATTVLLGERPTPAAVCRILREHRPTIFYGVPTLYSALLASPELPKREELSLRRCTSAGEALPPEVGRRWLEHTGVDILDGLGLHRNAAYLFVQPARRSALRHHGQTGAGLRHSPGRRRRQSGRQRRDRRAASRRSRPAPPITGTTGKKAAILFSAPGRAAATNTPKAKTVILLTPAATTTCSK